MGLSSWLVYCNNSHGFVVHLHGSFSWTTGMMDWDNTRIVFTKRTLIEFLRCESFPVVIRVSLELSADTRAQPSTPTSPTSPSFPVRIACHSSHHGATISRLEYATFGKISGDAAAAPAASSAEVADFGTFLYTARLSLFASDMPQNQRIRLDRSSRREGSAPHRAARLMISSAKTTTTTRLRAPLRVVRLKSNLRAAVHPRGSPMQSRRCPRGAARPTM